MRKEYDNGYYEGNWVDGKRNGLGTLYYNDGTYKYGYWEDDEFVLYAD